MAKILTLDDDPDQMKLWWNALVRSGHELTPCDSVDDAARHYNQDYYSLILLDRMVPLSEVFGVDDSTPSLEAGERVYKDIRRREHLQEVPIIILTNYYEEEWAKSLEQKDPRLKVLSKKTLPRELIKHVDEMILTWPMRQLFARIPEDEHPNIAPYYIQETTTGNWLRVYFKRCDKNDTGFLETPTQLNWVFREVFRQYLISEDLAGGVLKMLPHSANIRGVQTFGLYYSLRRRDDPNWYRSVLFETAPGLKHTDKNRPYKGVGKALVARFLREWLYRNGQLEADVLYNTAQFDQEGLRVESAITGADALLHIGFEEVRRLSPRNRDLNLSAEKARALLDQVSQRPPNPEK